MELFKIVATNNYDKLISVINTNKHKHINSIRGKYSLISKAVEVRAKECFDILLLNCDFKICPYNGFDIALNYWLEAPNDSNQYYFDKLLNSNIQITCHHIVQCIKINNNTIALMLFEQLDKNKQNIFYILSEIIKYNNMDIFNKVFDYFEEYTDNQFNEKLLLNALYTNKLSIVQFVINRTKSWKMLRNLPLLYSVYEITSNMIIFDYIYSLYLSLSNTELEELNNYSIKSDIINPNNVKEYIVIFNKLCSLPIKLHFDNIIENIINVFCFCNANSNIIAEFVSEYYDNSVYIIYLILKFDCVSDTFYSKVNKYYNYNNIKDTKDYIYAKESIIKFNYILAYLNKPFNQTLFASDELFEDNKNKYINKLNKRFNTNLKSNKKPSIDV